MKFLRILLLFIILGNTMMATADELSIKQDEKKGTWGYVNEKGKWAIKPKYLMAENFLPSPFSDVSPLALVQLQGDKYALINNKNKIVHEFVSSEKPEFYKLLNARFLSYTTDKEIFLFLINGKNEIQEDLLPNDAVNKVDINTKISPYWIGTFWTDYDNKHGKVVRMNLNSLKVERFNVPYGIIGGPIGSVFVPVWTDQVYLYDFEKGSLTDYIVLDENILYDKVNDKVLILNDYSSGTKIGDYYYIDKWIDPLHKDLYLVGKNDNENYILDKSSRFSIAGPFEGVMKKFIDDKVFIVTVGRGTANNDEIATDEEISNELKKLQELAENDPDALLALCDGDINNLPNILASQFPEAFNLTYKFSVYDEDLNLIRSFNSKGIYGFSWVANPPTHIFEGNGFGGFYVWDLKGNLKFDKTFSKYEVIIPNKLYKLANSGGYQNHYKDIAIFVDKDFNEIKFPYHVIEYINNNLFYVENKDGDFAFIDGNLNPVSQWYVPFNSKESTDKYSVGYTDLATNIEHTDQLLKVKSKETGKVGVFDMKYGYERVPTEYDNVGLYKNGFFPVRLNGKYGYVNSQGKLVIPIKYVFALVFNDQTYMGKSPIALVGLNFVGNELVKTAFIDDQGNILKTDLEIKGKFLYF